MTKISSNYIKIFNFLMFFSIFEMISPKELKWNNRIKMELHQVPSRSGIACADGPSSLNKILTFSCDRQKTPVEKEKITDSVRNCQRNYYLIHYWWKYEQNYEKNIDLKMAEIKNGEFGVLLKWFLRGLQASPWYHQAAVRQLLMRSTH